MSTAQVAEQIRDARAARRPLRVRGGGAWLGAGRPVSAQDSISLEADRGIVEYTPGDLTLTARAGTRLSELHEATRAHGQWLPLDPWGDGDGTLGATISTATAGPHSHATGHPRDVVLGLEFVTGSGSTVRSGGRVVKNVAGFDLTRLLTGSWGTLGVITEVTVRLRARPELTRTLAITISPRTDVTSLATRLRALPFTPLASELVNVALARTLGLGAEVRLLLQIGGNAKSVSGQHELLRQFGEPSDVDDSVWSALRASDAGARAVWRWSQAPSVFGETWTAASSAVRSFDDALLHGNPAHGSVRVALGSGSAAQLAQSAGAFQGTVAIEILPADAWLLFPAPSPARALATAIRSKFDPDRVLNPGILDGVT